MKAPRAHQGLYRHIERAARGGAVREGQVEHGPQVPIQANRTAAGAAVQLAEVARVVEQGQPGLDPAQLGEGRRAGIEPVAFRPGKHDDVHRLAHGPRPALDQPVGRRG
jgi:hypothetical protein